LTKAFNTDTADLSVVAPVHNWKVSLYEEICIIQESGINARAVD